MLRFGAVLIMLGLAAATARAANIADGSKALDDGQPDQAIAIFGEILKSEPRNAQAQHGMALAHLLRADNAKACAAADQALLSNPKPDRALALNAASAHFAMKNNARAARILKDYLAANPKALDEPALNALGTVLTAATAKEKQNRVFGECAAFYEQTTKRFEAARPGHRRFGGEWFTARDYMTLEASYNRNQRELDRLTAAVHLAEQQVATHQSEIARQQELLRRGDSYARSYLRTAEQSLLTAQMAMSAAQQKYEDFAANIDKPEFPDTIATVSMSAIDVPEFSAVQTLSAPDPAAVVTPGQPPRRRPRRGQPTPVPDPNPAATVKGGQITSPATQPVQPAVKKAHHHAVAFAITHNLMVTTAAGLDNRNEMKVLLADGTAVNARLVRKDDAAGLAIVQVMNHRLACLALAEKFEPGAVVCVTYHDTKPKGVSGNAGAPGEGSWLVAVPSHERIAGSPLLGGEGKVVGMCVGGGDAKAALAVTLAQLKAFVGTDAAKARPLRPGEDVGAAVGQVVVIR